MSAIEDKLRRKINEQKAQYQDEMEILLHTQKELTEGKNKLDTTIENLKKEKVNPIHGIILNERKVYLVYYRILLSGNDVKNSFKMYVVV